jgi:DNA modification methylase
VPESIRLPGRLVHRPLGAIKVAPNNPRRHPAHQVEQLVTLMRRFGWTAPLLVDETGELIAGEARLMAARRLKLATAPCVVLEGLNESERRSYRIADNRIALDATWDEALLHLELRDVEAAGIDIEQLGFGAEELARLFEPVPAERDAATDEVPPLRRDPDARLGDLWQLGAHRLICGDSTKSETLARLFADAGDARLLVTDPPYGMGYDNNRKLVEAGADLLVTDPPYGMAYDGGRAKADLLVTDPPYGMAFGKGKEAGSTPKGALVKAHGMILGDDVQGDALVDLVAGALTAALPHLRKGSAAYVFFTWRTYVDFHRAMQRTGLPVSACIVWDKGSIGLGFQHYRPQHEFCFYSAGSRWHGGKTEGDIWTLSRGATGEYVHPTQKPVALLERAIRNSSRAGDTVLDVFGGSGSTLIACERLGRGARLVELDPRYCDAIVRRWEAHAQRPAVRL